MIKIDEAFVIDTLTRLVQIDSRNPGLVKNGPGELEIGAEIAQLLRNMDVEVYTYPLSPNRMNVIGVLKGSGAGRSLMLNGHMDTVGVEGMADPFTAAICNGRLYGRGSQDMKGSLAAMLGAGKAIVDQGQVLKGDLILAFVADEEDRSLGTMDVVERYQADAAIVTEPTNLDLVIAHRGLCWIEVETFGKAAHGSRYQEGVDAIMRMGRFLAELEKLEVDLRGRPGHPLTGPPSLHTAVIDGGTDACTYAESCRVHIDRRTVAGETPGQVTAELQAILDQLSSQDPTFKAELRMIIHRPVLENSPDVAICRTVTQAFHRVLEKDPVLTGALYWSDAALLAAAGMEAILLGPVGAGLHGPEEWVEIQSILDLAVLLAETATQYCG